MGGANIKTDSSNRLVSDSEKTTWNNKAEASHTHTKNQVGLGNVDNTADSAKNVNSAAFPVGFGSRNAAASWGVQIGTFVTDWAATGGGDIQFRETDGQLYTLIDGYFYQNEGQYRCLDENNFSNYAALRNHNHNTSITDWNNAITSGFYISAAGASNAPVSDVGITGNVSATGAMIVQTVYPEEVDDISLTTYTRKGIKNSSTITWAKWIKHVELLKSCVIKQSSPDYQVSPSYFSIPTQVTCIYFTDIKIPSSVSSDAITDFSKDKDGGVVAWLDTNDDTKMYVSTQKEGVKVKGNAYSFSMFYDRNRNNNYFNSIDLSNFDTSKIVNMSYMFRYCTKLTTLDVSKFDTSNVINMDRMFSGCSSLTSLDVANWDTSNVLNMSHMFDGCSSLTRLDVSEWNTIDVIWMDGMFAECSSLTTIYIFCPNARYVDYMFDGCSSLTRIYISALMSVLSMSYMFIGCIHLDELYLYDVNTSCVTSMGHMFDGCSSLTS
ncbi:MAG TPA: hypothetical protein DCW90_02430, partial [Lachnospiraceae bacterium]|nr:hypothetical protein [Lachnospiraceae bacterium]